MSFDTDHRRLCTKVPDFDGFVRRSRGKHLHTRIKKNEMK
jgi:hypothetical protein